MEEVQTLLLWASAIGALLTAGIFFAFSNFVMRGLARLPAGEGAAAMNSINVTVVNPVFMALFLGAGLTCAALAVMSLLSIPEPAEVKIIAAAAVYIVGSIGVTMIFNVPLNGRLAAAPADSAALWDDYLKDWVMWNSVRGLASLAAGVLFVSALTG
jgi:uncharacterized membrane protein